MPPMQRACDSSRLPPRAPPGTTGPAAKHTGGLSDPQEPGRASYRPLALRPPPTAHSPPLRMTSAAGEYHSYGPARPGVWTSANSLCAGGFHRRYDPTPRSHRCLKRGQPLELTRLGAGLRFRQQDASRVMRARVEGDASAAHRGPTLFLTERIVIVTSRGRMAVSRWGRARSAAF